MAFFEIYHDTHSCDDFLDEFGQARIDEVTLTGQVGPNAQLLTPPYSLSDPVSPQPLIAVGTGALVGLLIAGGMAAVGAARRLKP